MINSLFFAVLHLISPDATALSFINILLFGLIFSSIFYLTNSIWLVAGLHSLWNFFQGIVFGPAVSGLHSFSSILDSVPVGGKDLLSGGQCGFEGGIVTTIVTGVILMITLVAFQKKYRSELV